MDSGPPAADSILDSTTDNRQRTADKSHGLAESDVAPCPCPPRQPSDHRRPARRGDAPSHPTELRHRLALQRECVASPKTTLQDHGSGHESLRLAAQPLWSAVASTPLRLAAKPRSLLSHAGTIVVLPLESQNASRELKAACHAPHSKSLQIARRKAQHMGEPGRTPGSPSQWFMLLARRRVVRAFDVQVLFPCAEDAACP